MADGRICFIMELEPVIISMNFVLINYCAPHNGNYQKKNRSKKVAHGKGSTSIVTTRIMVGIKGVQGFCLLRDVCE